MRCTIFELLFIADIATSFIFHFYTFSHEGQCFDIFPFCYSFFRYFSLSTFFPFDVFPFDIFPFRHFFLSTFFPFDIFLSTFLPYFFSLSTFFLSTFLLHTFRILTPETYSTFDHLSSIFNTICATNPIQVYIIRYRIKFCIEYNQLQTQQKSLSESGLQILHGLGKIQGISAETSYF